MQCQNNKTVLLFLLIAIIVGSALALGNPHSDNWLLKCPLHTLTGLQCPLCGAQRAAHELLNGNIKEAWTLNPGLFILSPYFLLLLAGALFPGLQESSKCINICYRDTTLFLVLALLLLWGIVRNIM